MPPGAELKADIQFDCYPPSFQSMPMEQKGRDLRFLASLRVQKTSCSLEQDTIAATIPSWTFKYPCRA
jgi:hypothetical protein